MALHHSLARFVALAALTLFISLASSEESLALTVSSGGFDQALGCSSLACGATQTLELGGGGVAAVSGSLDIDTLALTLSFSLSVVELAMTPVGGGDDNGLSDLFFLNTTYAGSDISLMELGSSFLVGPGQTASISGTHTHTGALDPSLFFAPDARVTGTCAASGSGYTCGLSFGQANFSFDVGSPTPETRYFQHTANFLTVPEPTTLALMGLGLFGIIVAGRRR